MYSLLLKIKKIYLYFKNYYYSIVIITPKSIYYKHQTISYKEQNMFGILHNIFSSLWLLIFFAFLFKDIIYLYLVLSILVFGFILFLLIKYKPAIIPKIFLTSILSISYFYKTESEIANIILYFLFLLLLGLNVFLGIKTYFFIRFLFFLRCFLVFIDRFYQAFPEVQINALKFSLIQDKQLLDVLHPMEKVKLDDFVNLQLKNNDMTLEDANNLLNRYKKLKKVVVREITIPYEREIINNKIIVYKYQNVANSINDILDKTEEAINSGLIK